MYCPIESAEGATLTLGFPERSCPFPHYTVGREGKTSFHSCCSAHLVLYLFGFVISVRCILALAAVCPLLPPLLGIRSAPTRITAQLGGQAGAGGLLPFRWFLFFPPQSRSLLRARCARRSLALVLRAERESLQHCVVRPTVRVLRRERESKAASQRTEKVAFLVLQRRQRRRRRLTDGPLCTTTATRNSSRRAFRGVRSSSLPSSLSLALSISLFLPFNSPRAAATRWFRERQARLPKWPKSPSSPSVPWWQDSMLLPQGLLECWGGCAANFLHG